MDVPTLARTDWAELQVEELLAVRKRLLTTTCAAGQRWCRSVSSEISGLLRAGCPVPWQQIGDAPGRIIRDSGDDVAEIGFGGKSV